MATRPKKKKTVKARTRPAPRRASAPSGRRAATDRVLCAECGRELVITRWGTTDRAIYCCGRVMECKS